MVGFRRGAPPPTFFAREPVLSLPNRQGTLKTLGFGPPDGKGYLDNSLNGLAISSSREYACSHFPTGRTTAVTCAIF